MSDLDVIHQWLRGQINSVAGFSSDANAVTQVDKILRKRRKRFGWVSVANNASLAEVPFYCADRDIAVTAAQVTLAANLTAAGTDNRDFRLAKRYANGAAVANVVAANTNTSGANGGLGNITSFVPISLGTVSSNTTISQLTSGDLLTFASIFAGAGVTLPAGYVDVDIREL